MNEILKKFTQQEIKEISESFVTETTKSIIDATKAAADSGSFEVVISTSDIDRQGESVNQAGWDLSNYMKNPVVLWGHDYYSLPIGICESIAVVDGQLVAKGRFAPEEANPFAQQVRRLYDLKIVRATSVGFIAKEMEGSIIMNAELLEFSFVPVPANPYALSLSKIQELKLDLAMIATKGLKLEAKAEGDACTMDDGTEGMMGANDQGEMVCMPKKAQTKPAVCEPESPDYDPQACGAIFCDPESPDYDQEACDLMKAYEAKKSMCAVCAREYPKGSKCNGDFFNIGKNHSEDAGHDPTKSMFYSEKKDAQQIGSILMQLQNIIDNAIVTASKLILDIIQSEYGQSLAGKAEITKILDASNPILLAIKTEIGDLEKKLGIAAGEEHLDGDALKQRSEDAGVVTTIKNLDDFLMARELLKSIVTIGNQSLERMNEKLRKGRENLKR